MDQQPTKIKEGDSVIVVNDKILPGNDEGPMIKVDQIYPVKRTCECTCGETHVDIGLKSHLNYVTCYKCSEELPESGYGHTHWCHSSRFDKIENAESSEPIQN